MNFAYADPPYIGYSKYYKDDPKCSEVNHTVLLGYLNENYDGFALSTHSTGLKTLLKLETCPSDIRIGAWVKPFCSFKKNVQPAYAWEAVLFKTSKKGSTDRETKRDWLAESMALKKGLMGAKPIKFCRWIFDILLMDENDELDDIFPGTGIVSQTWDAHKNMLQGKQFELELGE